MTDKGRESILNNNRKSRNKSGNSVPWINPSMRNNSQNQRYNNNQRRQVNQPGGVPSQPPVLNIPNIDLVRGLVIQKVNELRVQQEFPEVVEDPTLMSLAQARAEDMPNWYPNGGRSGHVSPNQGSPLDLERMRAGTEAVFFPYELLTNAFTSFTATDDQIAQAGMNVWLNSTLGHRFHLLWTPLEDQCDFIRTNFVVPPDFQCPPVVPSPERYTHIGVGYTYRERPEFSSYEHFFSLIFNNRNDPLYTGQIDPYDPPTV